MPQCVAAGCKNDSLYCRSDGVTFHKFPRNPSSRSIWVAAIRLNRGAPLWRPRPASVVCSAHFAADDLALDEYGVRHVKPSGYPKLFPWPAKNQKKLDDVEEICKNLDPNTTADAAEGTASVSQQQVSDENLWKAAYMLIWRRVWRAVAARREPVRALRDVPPRLFALACRHHLIRKALMEEVRPPLLQKCAHACVYRALCDAAHAHAHAHAHAAQEQPLRTAPLRAQCARLRALLPAPRPVAAHHVYRLWTRVSMVKKLQLLTLTKAGDRQLGFPAAERLDEDLGSVDWRLADLLLLRTGDATFDLVYLEKLESLKALVSLSLLQLATRGTKRECRWDAVRRVYVDYTNRLASVVLLQRRWNQLCGMAALYRGEGGGQPSPSPAPAHPLLRLIAPCEEVKNWTPWSQLVREDKVLTAEHLAAVPRNWKFILDFTDIEKCRDVETLIRYIEEKLLHEKPSYENKIYTVCVPGNNLDTNNKLDNVFNVVTERDAINPQTKESSNANEALIPTHVQNKTDLTDSNMDAEDILMANVKLEVDNFSGIKIKQVTTVNDQEFECLKQDRSDIKADNNSIKDNTSEIKVEGIRIE